jgi:hypothetical protein
VDSFSIAKYSSVLYVPTGLSYFEVVGFHNGQLVTVPLGFYFAFLHFTVNLHLPSPQSWSGISALVLFGIVAFAVTGWITGFVCALVYNLFARMFGGLRISVELE